MASEKPQQSATMAADEVFEKGIPQEKVISAPSAGSIDIGAVDDLNLDTVHAESEYTDTEYKKLLRKIDLRLLALMWVCSPALILNLTSINWVRYRYVMAPNKQTKQLLAPNRFSGFKQIPECMGSSSLVNSSSYKFCGLLMK